MAFISVVGIGAAASGLPSSLLFDASNEGVAVNYLMQDASRQVVSGTRQRHDTMRASDGLFVTATDNYLVFERPTDGSTEVWGVVGLLSGLPWDTTTLIGWEYVCLDDALRLLALSTLTGVVRYLEVELPPELDGVDRRQDVRIGPASVGKWPAYSATQRRGQLKPTGAAVVRSTGQGGESLAVTTLPLEPDESIVIIRTGRDERVYVATRVLFNWPNGGDTESRSRFFVLSKSLDLLSTSPWFGTEYRQIQDISATSDGRVIVVTGGSILESGSYKYHAGLYAVELDGQVHELRCAGTPGIPLFVLE